MDISLFKQVSEMSKTAVHRTNDEITVSFLVPEALRHSGRAYSIVRIHDGEAAMLEAQYDEESHMLSFETDRFSTYAVVYKDAAVSGDTAGPATGDTSATTVYAFMLMASCAAAAEWLTANRRRKKK